MNRMKNANNNNHDETKTTTTTMTTTTTTVTRKSRNDEPRMANSTNIVHSVMDVGTRNISETRNQVSNFPQFVEDPIRHQHFLYFYEPLTFPISSHCLMASFRYKLNQVSYVPYPPAIPIYLFNFSNSRIPLPQHLPYDADHLLQRQPENAEASSLSCQPDPFLWPSSFWVSPQRCPLMECDGERGHHSRAFEPRVVQPLVQVTRLGEGVSGTRNYFNDCYASFSTMLHFAPTYNPDSSYHNPPIFHVPLKPETPTDRQLFLKYQNFPSPPPIRYNLTPPDFLFASEENPLRNLSDMLQADLAPKRRSYLLEDIKSEPDTASSISHVHCPEDRPECISLGYLHSISPRQGMSKYLHQTQECDSSSSTEETTDDESFIDMESTEN